MLLELIIALVYFAVGLPVARRYYANQKHKYEIALPEWQAAYKAADPKYLLPSEHGPLCNLKWPTISPDFCSCHRQEQWRKARTAAKARPSAPISPWLVAVAYPIFWTHTYLTGGNVKKPNYARIAELEAENQLNQLD